MAVYLADTLIVATGARPNHLEIPGETEMTGKGCFLLRHLRRLVLQGEKGDRRRRRGFRS